MRNIPISSSSISDGKHSERNVRWNIIYHSVSFEYLKHNKFDTCLYIKVSCVLIYIRWATSSQKMSWNVKVYQFGAPGTHLQYSLSQMFLNNLSRQIELKIYDFTIA